MLKHTTRTGPDNCSIATRVARFSIGRVVCSIPDLDPIRVRAKFLDGWIIIHFYSCNNIIHHDSTPYLQHFLTFVLIYRYPRSNMSYPTKFKKLTFFEKWINNNVLQLILKSCESNCVFNILK